MTARACASVSPWAVAAETPVSKAAARENRVSLVMAFPSWRRKGEHLAAPPPKTRRCACRGRIPRLMLGRIVDVRLRKPAIAAVLLLQSSDARETHVVERLKKENGGYRWLPEPYI